MPSYHATRETMRARFFKEMGEATFDAERGRAIQSMVGVAHRAEYIRSMQQIVQSLPNICQTDLKIALQATKIEECILILYADPITNAIEIQVSKKV
ncbi:hypothetical protein AG0111_0g10692 [Alternaria gaisen]|uniref:Uncharacterized protein n=1 Tax=Alternaria gaisen TaxID=167740 RepID=A0ACB6F990_9PLEO|nr:hypothetical protein AG0111_0g10692 [Alternaria gaisen]